MEIGIHAVGGRTPAQWDGLRRLARLAEDSGATHLFLGDNHLSTADVSIRVLEAARATSRLRVGPGVTNAVVRHETVLLRSLSTVDDLVPGGRVFVGIGAGDTALRSMGLRAMSPAAMRAAVLRMRALMKSESVDYGGREVSMTDLGQLPICIFGEGPKMVSVAAEVADDLVYGGGVSPEVVRWAKQQISAVAAARPDPLPPVRDWYCAMVSIGASETAAKARIAPRLVNRVRHNLLANRSLIPDNRLAEADNLLANFVPGSPANVSLLTPYLFERFSIVGTLDQVKAQTSRIADSGVERLMLDFPDGTVADELELFTSDVLAQVP